MTSTLCPPPTLGPVTEILERWNDDPRGSLDEMLPLVVPQLRRIAQSFLASESEATVVATELVHELYLRLTERRRVHWTDRSQFFGFAARTMRRILVDRARRRHAAKRGAGVRERSLEDLDDRDASVRLDEELLALDLALERLESVDARLARVVELRHFVGLTIPEVAATLGIAEATVSRDWATARAWLFRELDANDGSRART